MEENLQAPQPVNPNEPVQPVYPANTIPNSPPPKNPNGSNMKFTFALIAGLILLVAGLSSYAYLSLNSKPKNLATTQSAVRPTLTPTPSVYTPNPNDTSNSAIGSDTDNINSNMTSLGNDIQNVDQSFSDQQPNLQ